jgi:tetratricopeptide (TPR) repeat protein
MILKTFTCSNHYRNVLILIISFTFFQSAYSQSKEDLARAKSEMAKAMKLLDSLKKNKDPRIASQMKSMDKMMNSVKAITETQIKVIENYSNQQTKSLPSANNLHDINKITNPQIDGILLMAKGILKEVTPKIDAVTKVMLDKILSDTSVNASGTAMLMMANGSPKIPGSYLIARDVLSHPKNPWKINDMGALLRDDERLKEALQCFFYAKDIVNSIIIINNIAWATYYYGDSQGAKKYFDMALKIDPNYRNALEGRALIAFQEGDIKALFACLVKEITDYGGITGLTPSEPFESICAEEAGNENNINLDHQPDPTEIKTFDNVGDNEPEQNSPPGADNDPVNYPDFKPMFDYYPGNMQQAQADGVRFMVIKMPVEIRKAIDAPKELMKDLPPLVSKIEDSSGIKIIKKKFKIWVDLFSQNESLFERRVRWHLDKCKEALIPVIKGVQNTDRALFDQFVRIECHNIPVAQCDALQCPVLKNMAKQGIADAAELGSVWMKYFSEISKECDWYNKSSSHFITRVHQQNWNHYLNVRRESAIRRAVLEFYNLYAGTMMNCGMTVYTDIYLRKNCSSNTEMGSTGAVDPYTKQIKKITTFVEPCFASPASWGIPGIFSYISNCESDKLSIGGGVSGFIEHIKDKKYIGDNYWHTGLSFGISSKIGAEQEIGRGKARVEGKIGLEGTAFVDYDSDLHVCRRGFTAKASIEAEASLTPGDTPFEQKLTLKNKVGVEAGIEIYSQIGQNSSSSLHTKFSGAVTK